MPLPVRPHLEATGSPCHAMLAIPTRHASHPHTAMPSIHPRHGIHPSTAVTQAPSGSARSIPRFSKPHSSCLIQAAVMSVHILADELETPHFWCCGCCSRKRWHCRCYRGKIRCWSACLHTFKGSLLIVTCAFRKQLAFMQQWSLPSCSNAKGAFMEGIRM